MKIELQSNCKADPNNWVKFGVDSLAHNIYIETHRGSSEHFISISRYEFEVIANVLLKLPQPDPQAQMKEFYRMLPDDCKVNPA